MHEALGSIPRIKEEEEEEREGVREEEEEGREGRWSGKESLTQRNL